MVRVASSESRAHSRVYAAMPSSRRLIHSLIDLSGELTLFTRVVNCKVGQLKEGDEVRLHVFPVDPVPVQIGREVVQKDRVFYAFEPVKK